MKIQKYIWSVMVILLLCSCFDDKGNYDYAEVPSVEIVKYLTNEAEFGSYFMLTVGDVVKVDPVLKFTGDSTTLALKYEWIVESSDTREKKSISKEKNLVWKTDMGGMFTVYLFITDTITSFQAFDRGVFMRARDNNSTSKAWTVLSEVDGKACFSILEDAGYSDGTNYIYHFNELVDYYSSQNGGQELGGSPVKLMNHWLEESSSSASGMVLILQNGGIGPVYVGTKDYRRALYLKDDFIKGALPDVTFKGAVANSKSHILLSEDGGLYMKAVEHLGVWFAGKYVDVPANVDRGMRIDRLVRMPYSGSRTAGTYALDGLNHRLLYIQNDNDLDYNGIWGDANAISEMTTVPTPGTTITLNNLKDLDILYCGSYVGSVQYEWGPDWSEDVFMFYKDKRAGSETAGQYCLYTFRFDVDPADWAFKAYPKVERALPASIQGRINEDGQFFVSPRGDLEFFFFTSGANNGELWGYIFRGTGGTDPIKLFDFEGRKITRISSADSGRGGNSEGMDLTVALETGDIYMFNVHNKHFNTGITPKWKSSKKYGKIVDILYNGFAKQAI